MTQTTLLKLTTFPGTWFPPTLQTCPAPQRGSYHQACQCQKTDKKIFKAKMLITWIQKITFSQKCYKNRTQSLNCQVKETWEGRVPYFNTQQCGQNRPSWSHSCPVRDHWTENRRRVTGQTKSVARGFPWNFSCSHWVVIFCYLSSCIWLSECP